MSDKIIRVTIVDDDLQPGDHIASHHPHPAVVRVLRDPYTAIPSSPRRAFFLFVILPVMVLAVIMAGVLAAAVTGRPLE